MTTPPPDKDTKTRLLDAAEALFARHGYHNTSLRAITTEARANLAAVSYHFGSKEALMTAVLTRRLTPLNRARSRQLAAVAEKAGREGRRPRTREVLLAFIEPTLLLKESCGGAQHFITLIGRALTEPDDTVRSVFLVQMRPVIEQLFGLLCQALPQIPKNLLFMRLNFVLGAVSHAMKMDKRWPALAPDIKPVHAYPPRDLIDILLPFLAAGLECPV